MSRVIGIDPSTKKLAMFAIQDQHHGVYATVLRGPKDSFDVNTVKRAYTLAVERFEVWKPDVVVIESPIVGGNRNARTAISMAEVVGALIAATHVLSVATHVALVPPSTWKKEVTGHGGRNKPDVQQWLECEHPRFAHTCRGDADLVDAACIAVYGDLLHSRSARLAG